MIDISDLKTKFRIIMDKIKLKKQVSPETEELCWLFFLSGYRENGGEASLISA